jgi:hypothetical protein
VIEESLNDLPFEQLISYLENESEFNASLLSKGDSTDQILFLVDFFHQAYHKSQKQNRRVSHLFEEI